MIYPALPTFPPPPLPLPLPLPLPTPSRHVYCRVRVVYVPRACLLHAAHARQTRVRALCCRGGHIYSNWGKKIKQKNRYAFQPSWLNGLYCWPKDDFHEKNISKYPPGSGSGSPLPCRCQDPGMQENNRSIYYQSYQKLLR